MKTRQQYEDEAIGHRVADDNCIGYSTQRQRFREGWDAAVKELTRWRNPKEELPEYYRTVLIKYLKGGLYTYAAAWLSVSDNNEYLWTIAETNMLISGRSVHYWRPIVELPYAGKKE